MSKNIFKYNHLLKPICQLITNHKHKKLIGWDSGFSKNDYKYPNRHDFYYKCKICGYVFFNNKKPNEKDMEFIKEYDKKEGE